MLTSSNIFIIVYKSHAEFVRPSIPADSRLWRSEAYLLLLKSYIFGNGSEMHTFVLLQRVISILQRLAAVVRPFSTKRINRRVFLAVDKYTFGESVEATHNKYQCLLQ